MLVRTIIAAAVVALLSAPAMAGQCPVDIGKIDAALATDMSLSDTDKAKVMELRNEGESLHSSGSHGDSVATLAKAKAILGIE
jgi:hypothetical protein